MRSGAAFGLVSAGLFGISTPVAKALLGEGMSPWLLAGLLYLGSGVGLWFFIVVRRRRDATRPEAPLQRADMPWLVAVVLSGGVAGPVLLMFGLTTTAGSAASLLLTVEGLATMAIAWLAFREPVGPRILVGAALIVVGAALVAWSGPAGFSAGAFLIVAACLAWAIDNNLTRRISAADPVQIAAIKGLAAGAVNLSIAFASGAALPGPSATAAALAVGLAGYGVSLVMFVRAAPCGGGARRSLPFDRTVHRGDIRRLVPGRIRIRRARGWRRPHCGRCGHSPRRAS